MRYYPKKEIRRIARPHMSMGRIKIEQAYNHNKKITDIFEPCAWEDKRCFIIGGGESLKGFNFERLKNELTIGINRSFEIFNSTLLYSMDTRFYGWIKHKTLDNFSNENVLEKWNNFKGYKIFLSPLSKTTFEGDVFLVKRILKKTISFDIEAGIFSGNNSGLGALMLAIAMGANPIYLLGYDMKVSKSTHWHSGYPSQSVNGQTKVLGNYRKIFEEFAPKIKQLGVRIVNLNRESHLRCFEFGDIDDVLSRNNEIVPKGFEIPEPVKKEFIVISYYTKDTGYEQESKNLIASMKRFNIPYHVEVIKNLGSWQKNTQYKAVLLKRMLDKYPDKSLLYVDCDAVFEQFPSLVEKLDSSVDIGIHYVNWSKYRNRNQWRELLNGTIYLNNNDRVKTLIDDWIRLNNVNTQVFEQRNLQKALENNRGKVKVYELPAQYCKIFDTMKTVDKPVVTHYQASRRFKKQIELKK